MKGSTISQESGGWRIIQSANGNDELDELVMRIQGVLCGKYLPPVDEMPRWVCLTSSRDALNTESGIIMQQNIFDRAYPSPDSIGLFF